MASTGKVSGAGKPPANEIASGNLCNRFVISLITEPLLACPRCEITHGTTRVLVSDMALSSLVIAVSSVDIN
jgi:hypothetical protein